MQGIAASRLFGLVVAAVLAGCGGVQLASDAQKQGKRSGTDETIGVDDTTGSFSMRLPKRKPGYNTRKVEIIVESLGGPCETYPAQDGDGGWVSSDGDGGSDYSVSYADDGAEPSEVPAGAALASDSYASCEASCSSSSYYNTYVFDYAEGQTLAIKDLPAGSYTVTVMLHGDVEEQGSGVVDINPGQTSYLQIVLGTIGGDGSVAIDIVHGGDDYGVRPVPQPVPLPAPEQSMD
jgi:hypothetical protein